MIFIGCLKANQISENFVLKTDRPTQVFLKAPFRCLKITNPVATGHLVHLPFFPNCHYVAFKAENNENVSKFFKMNKIYINF